MDDLSGRCVVVTGAAGNLGSAVCERLSRAGARIFALVHRDADREKVLGRVGGKERVEARAVELSAEDAVEAAYDAAAARFGPLWGAAHCAGTWAGAPLAQTTVQLFDTMIDVNLRSAFLCSRAAVRRMKDGGRIVNVAAWNPAVGVGVAGSSAYAASKAGVIALTKAIAEEGAHSIRASCVAPGTMRTPRNAAAMPRADSSHWVPVEDAAEAIAWLLSPAAGATNGAVLTLPSR